MNIFNATQKHYNISGVHPTTDPDNPRSQFAVDRYQNHLPKLIKPGMRALDLGCNAGRYTFAMEEMGAIATGIDFAEIPLRHAKEVAQKRKSRCQWGLNKILANPTDVQDVCSHVHDGGFRCCSQDQLDPTFPLCWVFCHRIGRRR